MQPNPIQLVSGGAANILAFAEAARTNVAGLMLEDICLVWHISWGRFYLCGFELETSFVHLAQEVFGKALHDFPLSLWGMLAYTKGMRFPDPVCLGE